MRAILKDRRGALIIPSLGFMFLLVLLVMLVVECGGILYSEDYANSTLQRAVNSAVEANMDDDYRADKILILKTEEAEQDFRKYIAEDFPEQFTVTIDTVNATAQPAKMEVTGTVALKTVFSVFGFEDLCFRFAVRSTNYDLH